MKFLRHLITLVVLAAISPGLQGQSLKAYFKKAEEAYNARNYSTALAHYRTILSEEPDRVDALFYAAESARQLRSYNLAEQYYESIPEGEKVGAYELTDYWLATVKKSMEKFDEASVLFTTFAEQNPHNTDYFHKSIAEIENCDWALDMVQNPLKVDVIQLSENINSYYPDYAPVLVGDTTYYTSTAKVKIESKRDIKKRKKRKKKRGKRKKKKKVDDKKKDKTQYAFITKIFRSVNDEKGKPIRQNSRKDYTHTANMALNTSKTRMFYTICPQDRNTGEMQCQLYYRKRSYSGNWERARRLPDFINMEGYISTQPTVGIDARTGKEVLFFASNRPGGSGGMDIWYSFIGEDDEFSQPQNLKVVNSPGEDLSPFFETHSQTLYFSSDHFQNLGGFDIFMTVKKGEEWTDPENLGFPINTSYDEMYYSFDVQSGRVLLASNRPGSLCVSESKDCNLHDIYEIVPNLDLVASAFNESDFSLLKGAEIELVDRLTGATEFYAMGDDEYYVHLALAPGRDYDMIVSKEGYETAETIISTKNFTEDSEPKKYVFLKPTQRLTIRTFDALTREPLRGMSIRVTDQMTKKSQTYEIAATDYEVSIPVEKNRDYLIVGIKSGFDAITKTVSMSEHANDLVINQDLYVRSFIGGLPITLYFDNDYPRMELDQGHLTYEDAYRSYIDRKGDFINEYAADLTGIEKELARLDAYKFFDEELQAGYYGLLKFSENLLFYLQNGDKVELVLEGYASPLADEHYNEKLAERRLQTIVNHFETYGNGVLKPYIGKEFKLEVKPFGESHASTSISDDSTDRRSSVFSPRASKERKVVIAGFRTTANSNVSSK